MAVEAVDVAKIAGLEITTVAEKADKIKLLIYGDPGVGKTTLVASAEEVESMRPVLFVDIEGGLKSIRKKFPDIHTITIKTDYDDKGKPKKLAWDKLYELYEELKLGKHSYNTIIIDSVTEAYRLLMEWVMYHLVMEKDHRDPDIADKREYAKARSRMTKMMRSFRDLDAHVLFTAQKDVKTDNESGRIINYIPGVSGKLAYELSQWMDELLYMDVDTKSIKEGGEENKGTRRLLSQPINKYLAKDRSDALPLLLLDPTMAKLADLILD